MKENNILKSERTKVKRQPQRGLYDFNIITQIMDETFICQVGFSVKGQPFVIPTCFGRKEKKIYFHGARASRMLTTIKENAEICFSVTILDGIVLARSAFHHSINYRSVILFGNAEEVVNKEEKIEALKIISDQIITGRWKDVRKPNDKELNSTTVLSFEIKEGSAKIRSGPAVDDEEDLDLPVWAGIMPVKTIFGEPEPDKKLNENISVPAYLKKF